MKGLLEMRVDEEGARGSRTEVQAREDRRGRKRNVRKDKDRGMSNRTLPQGRENRDCPLTKPGEVGSRL